MTSHTRVAVIGAGLETHPDGRGRDVGAPRSRGPHHSHATGEAEARPGRDAVPLAVAAPGAFTHDGGS
ncbi:hypothetical protein AB0N16_13035 [Streptomyces sp. NPDC051105]|uniref:hypothetical protein n=1 Tax=Streptomyces sp. NPDC051105 TaxID=3154843 RepID=UPI003448C3A7